MMRNGAAIVVGVVLVTGSLASVAVADTVDLAYQYVTAGGTMSVYLDGNYYGQGYNWCDGIQKITTRNPTGPLAEQVPATAWAVCYDLSKYTTFNFTTYQVVPLQDAVGQDKVALIAQLWAKHYDPSWESSTPIYYGGNNGGFVSGQPAATAENQNALAFVYAVYEIAYDFDGTLASLNLTAGRFQMSATNDSVPGTFATVQNWLGELTLPSEYAGPLPTLAALTSGTQQNLIVAVSVPEPATLALLAFGGLVTVIRRKRK